MKDLIEALKGKKTYIVAGMIVLIVICEKVLGFDIPGAEAQNPLNYILAALGLSTLRAGITNNNG